MTDPAQMPVQPHDEVRHEQLQQAQGEDVTDATATSEAAIFTQVDPLLTETAARFFEENCSPEAVQAAERTDEGELWTAYSALGFACLALPVEFGGGDGTLLEALEVLRLAGYYCAPIPAAESGLLAGWLSQQIGLAVLQGEALTTPTRPVNLSIDNPAAGAAGEVLVSGRVEAVPWASLSARMLALVPNPSANPSAAGSNSTAEHLIISVPLDEARIEPAKNMAGEPRDTIVFYEKPALASPAPPGVTPNALELRGALSRTALMSGALRRMSQLTVDYTNERVQFGRPIARFQAVQQHLVWAAQQAALIEVSAKCAGLAAYRADLAGDLEAAAFPIASAKLIANQAAALATKACHQAHGAMGMTQEYPLHHLSRRLWSWRQEYGSEQRWARQLGTIASTAGADGLYPLITSGRLAAAS